VCESVHNDNNRFLLTLIYLP